MQHRKIDYVEDNSLEYKKSSNKFLGATFAIILVIVMIGMIFG
jgi:hypothetical protein